NEWDSTSSGIAMQDRRRSLPGPTARLRTSIYHDFQLRRRQEDTSSKRRKDFAAMTIGNAIPRPLGTMVAYGFAEIDLAADLALAGRIGATVLEIFPAWRSLPDPTELHDQVNDHGLTIHSAHGCWGGQSIQAERVDLGQPDPTIHRAS